MALSKAHLALALSLAACTSSAGGDGTGGALPTSSSTTGEAGSGGGGGLALVPTPIVGTAIDRRYHHGALVAEEPHDLTIMPIAAVVLQQGTWQTYPGVGHADGTFEIHGVPDGPYWLYLERAYWLTSQRQHTIVGALCGRADGTTASTGTMLALLIDGLYPTADGGLITVASPDFGGVGYIDSSTNPPLGATSANLVASWHGRLLEAPKGDDLFVSQTSAETSSNGWAYWRLARFGVASGVDLVDGATTSVSVSLPEPAYSMADIDFRGQEFVDRLTEAAPLLQAPPETLLGGVAEEEHACDRAVLFAWNPWPIEVSDAHIGLVSFVQPSYSWPRRIEAEVHWYSDLLAPGAQEPYPYPQVIRIEGPLAEIASQPIRPLVAPVRDIEVNGSSAFVPLDGVGTSPVVSWKPPAVGTVSEYRLTVVRAYVDVHSDDLHTIALPEVVFHTTDTSITLPPGIMVAGERYMLMVSAYHAATAASGPDSITGLATNPTALMTP